MSDEETWAIKVADRTFDVPRLPFRVSRVVYPICQRLTNGGLAERLWSATPGFEVTDAEVDDLAKITFLACKTADPELTEEAFGDMPITPPQLFDAFWAIRVACGGWRALPKPATEGEDREAPGEEHGAKPPTSTSTTSSDS